MRPPAPTTRRRIRPGAVGRAAVLSVAISATVLGLGLRFPGEAAPTSASAQTPSPGALLPIGTGAYSPSSDTTAEPAATSGALPSAVASLLPAADTLPASSLADSGIPATALDAYRRAAAAAPASCHIDWSLIAAIGRVESNHGRFAGAVLHSDGLSTPPVIGPRLDGNGTALIPDTDGGRLDGDPVYDRAVGPMQFIPSTWARYAQDGNGDGTADPFNIFDAARATAVYLCAAGGDLSALAGQQQAVLAYNHSDSYVATVLTLAATYAGTLPPVLPPVAPAAPVAVPPADPGQPAGLTEAPLAAATPAPLTTTEPPSTPPGTTTSPSTTPPTTTPPTTSPPGTTPPTTTPPTSTPPDTTPPSTTLPPTTPPTTTAPDPTPAPTTTSPVCPVDPATQAPVVVDVVDQTGDAANGTAAADDLTSAGLTLGTVTSAVGTDGSAIEYPATAQLQAQQLAGDLGTAALLKQADVPHVTLVLGATDSAALLTALHTAAATPLCPTG